jgi:serine phosphatase RsbU (regulator of sigma subunit)
MDTSSHTDPRIVAVGREQQLRALLELARDLGDMSDRNAVLGKILETLFRIFPQAERGFILLRGDGTDELIVGASKFRARASSAPQFSRTLFDHVFGEGQAILCQDVEADGRFSQARSTPKAQIRTMMCVPLWDHGPRPIGVLQIDACEQNTRFKDEDLNLLVAIAAMVNREIENGRLHEIADRHRGTLHEARHASEIQRKFLRPAHRPQLRGYEFWDFYKAARFVGGDYYDYRPNPGAGPSSDHTSGRWAIAIGDVSGKGMPASLLKAKLFSEVGLLFQTEPDVTRVIERLNRNLCETGDGEMFITLLLVLLDGEQHLMKVVNAGHMAPLIRRCGGGIEVIGQERSGPPLGVVENYAYESIDTSIRCGDVAVLYTDGVNEAMDTKGSEFGSARLQEVLVNAPCGASAVGEAILSAVHRHAAGRDQSDDITLICLGRS